MLALETEGYGSQILRRRRRMVHCPHPLPPSTPTDLEESRCILFSPNCSMAPIVTSSFLWRNYSSECRKSRDCQFFNKVCDDLPQESTYHSTNSRSGSIFVLLSKPFPRITQNEREYENAVEIWPDGRLRKPHC